MCGERGIPQRAMLLATPVTCTHVTLSANPHLSLLFSSSLSVLACLLLRFSLRETMCTCVLHSNGCVFETRVILFSVTHIQGLRYDWGPDTGLLTNNEMLLIGTTLSSSILLPFPRIIITNYYSLSHLVADAASISCSRSYTHTVQSVEGNVQLVPPVFVCVSACAIREYISHSFVSFPKL